MAAIELPDRGQPIDISYLLRIATEINNLNSIISTGGTESSIKYLGDNSVTRVLTNDLVIYSASQQISGNLSTDTNLQTTFDFSFQKTPIVVSSVQYVSGEPSLFPVIKNINNNGCSVALYSTKTSGAVVANVSIIAIGERA